MMTLSPRDVNDIVASLAYKAAADRAEARKLVDKETDTVSMEFKQLHDALIEQAQRQDALADKLLDESLMEVEA